MKKIGNLSDSEPSVERSKRSSKGRSISRAQFTPLAIGVGLEPATLEERLAGCPTDPGVYLMKDVADHVIYVGKAKSLRARVRGYFQSQSDMSAKTIHLVSKVQGIEFLRTGSEVEAFLLENSLIKKFKPKYNIRLKDDKTYPYLKLDLNHPFPRPYIARKQIHGDGNEYFGPFPMSGHLRTALGLASKVFQLRDCRDHDFANRSRPCISYDIGQCTAPCVGKVTQEAYAAQVQSFREFLNGDSGGLEEKWEEEMSVAAEKTDFEKAALLRDRLAAIRSVSGADQRVISLGDTVDRDIWALFPMGPAASAQQDLLSLVIIQFRGGQWLGSSGRIADLSEAVEGEDLLASLLFQHYAKHPLPAEIVIPPDVKLPGLLASNQGNADGEASKEPRSLAEALAALQPGSVIPHFRSADETETFAKLWELARDNAENQYKEQNELRLKKSDGLLAIAKMLDLEKIPRRMECVDISNLQGEANVASCVVFIRGQPEKSEYRHYKIAGFDGQNDFASMKEVMSRRYGKTDSPIPDLLVIDGGKGQLASVMEILKGLGCNFPVVGLAKARTKSDFESSEIEASEERLFVPGQKNYIRIKNAEALKILTHLRDEAHRFAIEFHRQKRSENRGL